MLDFLDSDLGTIPDIPSHRRSGSNGIGQAASSASLASMAGGPGGAVANANPEADSYAHMETVLEALAVLGRLGSALDTVAQRVPGEIHALVETTLDEVEER
jgi:exocyst complex component 4